ncbi:hypothetical protein ACFL0N_05120 [Pseudomonadota bacterium]
MNPLTRFLAGILAVLALVGAFFFGIFVLIFALGFGLVAWLALSLRMWWLRRKSPSAAPPGKDHSGDVIDAEYTVVSRRDEE